MQSNLPIFFFMFNTFVSSQIILFLFLAPGSGRSPGEGNDCPLLYSCLEKPMDGGACWAIVHSMAKSQT